MEFVNYIAPGDSVLLVWSDLGSNPNSLQDTVNNIKVQSKLIITAHVLKEVENSFKSKCLTRTYKTDQPFLLRHKNKKHDIIIIFLIVINQ